MQAETVAKPIYVIAGPTASGKTALGVRLAEAVGGEVINCDSVQIYKGIQIATAKPSEEEKQGVPHHLIDYVDPNVNYTAADWAHDAAGKITEIESRRGVPILVGGTGFYFRTLMRPLFESPKTDERLRERLREIHRRRGPQHLYRMLRRVDPESAAEMFERDYVRVMRALEVYFQTGNRLSEIRAERAAPPEFADRMQLFVLNPPRERLYEKINTRTLAHFDAGLVDEVRELLASGIAEGTNALGAHGYRRVCEFLRGERTLESAIEKSQQDVRNYAKRQLTWLRREEGAFWLDGFGDEEAVWEKISKKIRESYSNNP
ncbi:MAG: tRNA (adenosine(37)-N6)-dimethylallyltransferase MiaA [Pyrinomonadaceae bacterium]|nr:tRNA (adenosine(37)-N6)-dimethylallyltransferase MiaA [Pyrinomonadaceae bacterium]